MPKVETRGRKRINKELTTPIAFAVEPSMKYALKDEAKRRGMNLSRMGVYAIKCFLKMAESTARIDKLNREIPDGEE